MTVGNIFSLKAKRKKGKRTSAAENRQNTNITSGPWASGWLRRTQREHNVSQVDSGTHFQQKSSKQRRLLLSICVSLTHRRRCSPSAWLGCWSRVGREASACAERICCSRLLHPDPPDHLWKRTAGGGSGRRWRRSSPAPPWAELKESGDVFNRSKAADTITRNS